ncbi:MAG: sel1 repeat family protein, partial [Acetobacteraceae bacterium]|nr:sel1 repeat family protein [Acetobacteraceae bacterium]
KTLVTAYVWFNLAAARLAPSDPLRQQAVRARDRLAAMLPPYQLVEAQRTAREWKPGEE